MVEVTTFTEAGGHPLNEDAFLVERHPADPECWLCFLADGQGGRSGGGEAARLACRAGLDGAVRAKTGLLAGGRSWASLLRISDFAVAEDVAAGFTTLAGFCIHNGAIAGASSGDSAVLVVSGGEARELTAGQRKNPPVGSTLAEFIPFMFSLTEPWKVLAMSDGVWKYVGWDKVVRAATTLSREALIDALKDAARLPGSGRFPDDFTVVMLECSGT
jgi:serine/threonine protein phosphatase PrpC